jgi:hypothetical protein
MNRIFRGFCINWFGMGPLHYYSSLSNFCFEFAEKFLIEKGLPDSFSGSRQGKSTQNFKNFEKRLPDTPSRGVVDSPTHRHGGSATSEIQIGNTCTDVSFSCCDDRWRAGRKNSPVRSWTCGPAG